MGVFLPLKHLAGHRLFMSAATSVDHPQPGPLPGYPRSLLVSGYGHRCISAVYSQTQVCFSLDSSPSKRGCPVQLGNSLTRIRQVSA